MTHQRCIQVICSMVEDLCKDDDTCRHDTNEKVGVLLTAAVRLRRDERAMQLGREMMRGKKVHDLHHVMLKGAVN